MQTFRGFIFHGCTERVALYVVSEQRTEKNGRSRQRCDHENNRDRPRAN